MAENFKYLAIKNWEIYQPKNKKPFPWIRDYKEKDSDPDFMSLTMLQRYVLDGCCRLRARFSKNLRNDPMWIARALCVLPEERRFIGQAIAVLCLRGFLIPTNQQDALLEERRGEEKRGEEKGISGENLEPSAEEKQHIEMDRHSAATGLGAMVGMSTAGFNFDSLVSAIDQGKRRWPELKNEQVAERIRDLWKEYVSQKTHVKQSLKNWLDSVGRFIDSDDWKTPKLEEFKPQIDWQGGYVGQDGVYVTQSGQRVPGYKCPPKPKAAGA